jgi:putative ABC transport system substrate-binding protein
VTRGGPRGAALLAAVLLLLPSLAGAQASEPKRIAVLTPAVAQWREQAFRDALRKLGYIDGTNLVLDIRSADGRLDRLPELGRDVVRHNPHVIVGINTPGTRAAFNASKNVPIVMAMVGDPVGLGFIASLARPGGTITGLSNMSGSLAGKRLELLREAVPAARRIALLYHPDEPIVKPQVDELEAIGRPLGLQFKLLAVRSESELSRAFEEATAWPADAMIRLAGQAATLGRQTAQHALQRRLPAMLFTRRDVEAGGLMAYYVDEDDVFRRVARYVDQILKGASPRDLPVEQPSRFELAVNVKTARELNVTLPPALLLRADHVIR